MRDPKFEETMGDLATDEGNKPRPANYGRPAFLSILCALCLLPFVNKAYTIDDPLFMWVAEHIERDFTDFFRFNVNWETRPKPMWEETRNPPLASYYIAAIAQVAGTSEPVMHLAFLGPAVLAILGTYRLAEFFCARPMFAALFTLVTPAFLVSSTNVMCDTMMLALWVWAILWWERGLRSGRIGQLLGSAVLIGLCALTKYYGICLVPLLAIYTYARRQRLDWALPALIVPIAMLAGYQWLTYRLYGQNLLYEAVTFSRDIQAKSATRITARDKFIEGLTFMGGSVAPLLFLALLLLSRRVLAWALFGMFISGWIIYLSGLIGPFKVVLDDGAVRWWVITQAVVWSAVGAGVFALIVADGWRARDAEALLLGLWVFGTFVFAAFLNWAINVRSVMPMVPAVGILTARRLDRLQLGDAVWKRAGWLLVPAGALTMFLCWADYQFAGSMREAARQVMAGVRSKRVESSVWFQGHWGFQYYMQQAGGKIIDRYHMNCRPGDIMVIPVTNNYGSCLMPEDSVRHEATIEVPTSRGVATMHMLMGAGYYANRIGPLPFAFGPVTPETYEVYQLLRPVEGELKTLPWDGHDFIRPSAPGTGMIR